MGGLDRFVVSSRDRLAAARDIADELRHDERLHKLAMLAVFVLEDCHEVFSRLNDQPVLGRVVTPPVSDSEV